MDGHTVTHTILLINSGVNVSSVYHFLKNSASQVISGQNPYSSLEYTRRFRSFKPKIICNIRKESYNKRRVGGFAHSDLTFEHDFRHVGR